MGARAALERSAVTDTRLGGAGGYGDGLLAAEGSTLDVTDTAVERCVRAGLLFIGSGGSVHRCLVRGNVFAIDLEQGAKPTIGTDNLIQQNKENEISSSGLTMPPPPKESH